MSTAPASSFDLSSLTRHDTLRVDILHPVTGQPTGMVVVVHGADSPTYGTAMRTLVAKGAQAPRATRRGQKADPEEEARQAEANAVALLAACTASWEGVLDAGQPLACTQENVRRVYQAHPWLRRQVDEAIADRASFFEEKPSSSSASPSTHSA